MNWKKEIQAQLKDASKKNCIRPKLKQLVLDLLDGDSEFKMIYNNSEGKYCDIRFTQPISVNTKLIILKKHNLTLYKYLKQKS